MAKHLVSGAKSWRPTVTTFITGKLNAHLATSFQTCLYYFLDVYKLSELKRLKTYYIAVKLYDVEVRQFCCSLPSIETRCLVSHAGDRRASLTGVQLLQSMHHKGVQIVALTANLAQTVPRALRI